MPVPFLFKSPSGIARLTANTALQGCTPPNTRSPLSIRATTSGNQEEAARHASMLLGAILRHRSPGVRKRLSLCTHTVGVSPGSPGGWPSNFEPNPPSRPSIKTSRPPTTCLCFLAFPRGIAGRFENGAPGTEARLKAAGPPLPPDTGSVFALTRSLSAGSTIRCTRISTRKFFRDCPRTAFVTSATDFSG